MERCLYCNKPLEFGEKDFHAKCVRKFFGTPVAPILPYTRADLSKLAKMQVMSQTALAGVQAKLSMNIEKAVGEASKLTIVGLWGDYILKPQSDKYPHLPENENVSMALAETMGIATVPNSLIRMKDGELCYITKRIDRNRKGEKFDMEDMCQLSSRLTCDKYKGSYERIAKIIDEFSAFPALDKVDFAEQILFSWLIGNSDMHLKNFSLYAPTEGEYRLTPAYDMLNVKLVLPSDDEELALQLDGKKKKLKRENFERAFTAFGIPQKAIENIFKKFIVSLPKMLSTLQTSHLPCELQALYTKMILERSKKVLISKE